MKKIMILGAGIYQLPLIKLAKEKGYYVIVVSIPGNYPGFSIADKVYYINTTDYEAVYEVAKEEKIDAITLTGTDVAVVTVGYVCDKLGIPGPSFEAAKRATNKALMKEAFARGNVCTADFQKVYSIEEAIMSADKIGYPVMLKIVDKSGSRGISKANSKEELIDAYKYAIEYTDLPYLVVEKYIKGIEIGVDALIQNGKVILVVPHEKLVYQSGRTGIPIGHVCPMIEDDNTLKKIDEEVRSAIVSLGIDNCAVNVDAFITEEGNVSIIEVAGRCGATGIPEVISGYIGMNYYEMILKIALGEKITKCFGNVSQAALSYLFYSERDGELDYIEYEINGNKVRCPDYKDASGITVHLDYIPGENVEKFTNGTKRLGLAIITDTNRDELINKYERFKSSIVIKVR